ncbi:MAG: PH domain-containing protein [Candidatus Methanomethyliaceae archaeon]|nr:PH domain-containing protein [Candidatus Methanomethyliaceae archaeon]MDW7971181.1 PH domain-containing protein [Nitrososphaerota archaeon]
MYSSRNQLLTLYEFKSPYDSLVRAVTITVVVGLMILFALISYIAQIEGEGFIVIPLLATVYSSITIVPYLFSPRGFALTTSGILIKRVVKSILIPYSEISNVKRISWTWKGARLGASGGLFGFFGLFHIQGLGKVWMYVTDRSKMIYIEVKQGKKYIISPDAPQAFLEKLKSMLPT